MDGEVQVAGSSLPQFDFNLDKHVTPAAPAKKRRDWITPALDFLELTGIAFFGHAFAMSIFSAVVAAVLFSLAPWGVSFEKLSMPARVTLVAIESIFAWAFAYNACRRDKWFYVVTAALVSTFVSCASFSWAIILVAQANQENSVAALQDSAPWFAYIVAITILPAVAGAGMEDLLLRFLSGRKRSSYRTASGKEIPIWTSWASPILYVEWVVIACLPIGGYLLAVGGTFVKLWNAEGAIASLAMMPLILLAPAEGLGVIAVGVAVCLFYYQAQRRWPHDTHSLLENRSRKICLYLRSFGDDDKLMTPPTLWGRIRRILAGFLVPSFEWRLGRMFRERGEMIAIGRPDERLPNYDIPRIYCADEHWKEVVADLLDRSQLVVLRIGQSAGLIWEINESLIRLQPQQLTLYFPIPLGDSRRRQWTYEEMRRQLLNFFPEGLPPLIGKASFLRFGSDPPWKANWTLLALPGLPKIIAFFVGDYCDED